jgi:hypothetical protein
MEIKVIKRDEFFIYLDEMIDLYNSTFRNKVNREYFIWRYIKNSDELLISLAFENNKIVSSYSAIPMKLRWNVNDYKSALIMHTMTHSDFQGKGLFAKTGLVLYEHLKNMNYKIIWGFPNVMIHASRINKLGWVDIYEFPTMSCSVKNNFKIDSEIIFDDKFCLDYSYIDKKYEKISVEKNKNYLQWRYSECPNSTYNNIVIRDGNFVIGYMVLKKYENKINIVDHYFNNNEDFDHLFNQAISFAINNECDLITTWANINSKYKLILEKKGFTHSLPITYFSGKLLDDICGLDYNIQNWDLAMGDDNVY